MILSYGTSTCFNVKGIQKVEIFSRIKYETSHVFVKHGCPKKQQNQTRSGSVLTVLIPPTATNSSFPKVGKSEGQSH